MLQVLSVERQLPPDLENFQDIRRVVHSQRAIVRCLRAKRDENFFLCTTEDDAIHVVLLVPNSANPTRASKALRLRPSKVKDPIRDVQFHPSLRIVFAQYLSGDIEFWSYEALFKTMSARNYGQKKGGRNSVYAPEEPAEDNDEGDEMVSIRSKKKEIDGEGFQLRATLKSVSKEPNTPTKITLDSEGRHLVLALPQTNEVVLFSLQALWNTPTSPFLLQSQSVYRFPVENTNNANNSTVNSAEGIIEHRLVPHLAFHPHLPLLFCTIARKRCITTLPLEQQGAGRGSARGGANRAGLIVRNNGSFEVPLTPLVVALELCWSRMALVGVHEFAEVTALGPELNSVNASVSYMPCQLSFSSKNNNESALNIVFRRIDTAYIASQQPVLVDARWHYTCALQERWLMGAGQLHRVRVLSQSLALTDEALLFGYAAFYRDCRLVDSPSSGSSNNSGSGVSSYEVRSRELEDAAKQNTSFCALSVLAPVATAARDNAVDAWQLVDVAPAVVGDQQSSALQQRRVFALRDVKEAESKAENKAESEAEGKWWRSLVRQIPAEDLWSNEQSVSPLETCATPVHVQRYLNPSSSTTSSAEEVLLRNTCLIRVLNRRLSAPPGSHSGTNSSANGDSTGFYTNSEVTSEAGYWIALLPQLPSSSSSNASSVSEVSADVVRTSYRAMCFASASRISSNTSSAERGEGRTTVLLALQRDGRALLSYVASVGTKEVDEGVRRQEQALGLALDSLHSDCAADRVLCEERATVAGRVCLRTLALSQALDEVHATLSSEAFVLAQDEEVLQVVFPGRAAEEVQRTLHANQSAVQMLHTLAASSGMSLVCVRTTQRLFVLDLMDLTLHLSLPYLAHYGGGVEEVRWLGTSSLLFVTQNKGVYVTHLSFVLSANDSAANHRQDNVVLTSGHQRKSFAQWRKEAAVRRSLGLRNSSSVTFSRDTSSHNPNQTQTHFLTQIPQGLGGYTGLGLAGVLLDRLVLLRLEPSDAQFSLSEPALSFLSFASLHLCAHVSQRPFRLFSALLPRLLSSYCPEGALQEVSKAALQGEGVAEEVMLTILQLQKVLSASQYSTHTNMDVSRCTLGLLAPSLLSTSASSTSSSTWLQVLSHLLFPNPSSSSSSPHLHTLPAGLLCLAHLSVGRRSEAISSLLAHTHMPQHVLDVLLQGRDLYLGAHLLPLPHTPSAHSLALLARYLATPPRRHPATSTAVRKDALDGSLLRLFDLAGDSKGLSAYLRLLAAPPAAAVVDEEVHRWLQEVREEVGQQSRSTQAIFSTSLHTSLRALLREKREARKEVYLQMSLVLSRRASQSLLYSLSNAPASLLCDTSHPSAGTSSALTSLTARLVSSRSYLPHTSSSASSLYLAEALLEDLLGGQTALETSTSALSSSSSHASSTLHQQVTHEEEEDDDAQQGAMPLPLWLLGPKPSHWVDNPYPGGLSTQTAGQQSNKKELEKVAAYYRFSDAAYMGDALYTSSHHAIDASKEVQRMARLCFVDLSKWEAHPLELYLSPPASSSSEETSKESFKVEFTQSNVDPGDRHEAHKLLCDLVHYTSGSSGSGDANAEGTSGLRLSSFRGDSCDLGLYHKQKTRLACTIECNLALYLSSPSASASARSSAPRQCVLMERRSAVVPEEVLWRLSLDLTTGLLSFCFNPDTSSTTNTSPASRCITSSVDVLSLLNTSSATSTADADVNSNSQQHPVFAADSAHFHHLALCIDASNTHFRPETPTSPESDPEDTKLCASGQAVAVSAFIDGVCVLSSSSTSASTSSSPLLPAPMKLAHLQRTSLLMMSRGCEEVCYRLTELRMWAQVRSAEDLERLRESSLGLAEKRVRLQMQLKGAKKLFAGGFVSVDVPADRDFLDKALRFAPKLQQQQKQQQQSQQQQLHALSAAQEESKGTLKGLQKPPLPLPSSSIGNAIRRPTLAAPLKTQPPSNTTAATVTATPALPPAQEEASMASSTAATTSTSEATMTARERRLKMAQAAKQQPQQQSTATLAPPFAPPVTLEVGALSIETSKAEANPTKSADTVSTSQSSFIKPPSSTSLATLKPPSNPPTKPTRHTSFTTPSNTSSNTSSSSQPPSNPVNPFHTPSSSSLAAVCAMTISLWTLHTQVLGLGAAFMAHSLSGGLLTSSAHGPSMLTLLTSTPSHTSSSTSEAGNEEVQLVVIPRPSSSASATARSNRHPMRLRLPASLGEVFSVCAYCPHTPSNAPTPTTLTTIAHCKNSLVVLHSLWTPPSLAPSSTASVALSVDCEEVLRLPLGKVPLLHASFLAPEVVLLVTATEAFTWRCVPTNNAAAAGGNAKRHHDPVKILKRCDLLKPNDEWRSRSVLQLQVSSAAMGDRWTLLSTRTARSDLSTSACTSWLHRENEEAEADSLRATVSEVFEEVRALVSVHHFKSTAAHCFQSHSACFYLHPSPTSEAQLAQVWLTTSATSSTLASREDRHKRLLQSCGVTITLTPLSALQALFDSCKDTPLISDPHHAPAISFDRLLASPSKTSSLELPSRIRCAPLAPHTTSSTGASVFCLGHLLVVVLQNPAQVVVLDPHSASTDAGLRLHVPLRPDSSVSPLHRSGSSGEELWRGGLEEVFCVVSVSLESSSAVEGVLHVVLVRYSLLLQVGEDEDVQHGGVPGDADFAQHMHLLSLPLSLSAL